MDIEVIKPFISHEVEVLVAGVWIEGHLSPIVKGVITLLPLGEAAAFYGPCALKADVIQAIRQVKRQAPANIPVPETNNNVRSSMEPITPGTRFVRK
jgi:hypothetical protein